MSKISSKKPWTGSQKIKFYQPHLTLSEREGVEVTPECPKGVFRSGGKLFEIIKLVFYIFLLKSTKIDRLKYTKHVITTQFTSRGGI